MTFPYRKIQHQEPPLKGSYKGFRKGDQVHLEGYPGAMEILGFPKSSCPVEWDANRYEVKLKGPQEGRWTIVSMAQISKSVPTQTAPIEFGYGGINDWPLHIPSKGKIYGAYALTMWHKENPGHLPYFRTPEAAQKWVDKSWRKHAREQQRKLKELELSSPE